MNNKEYQKALLANEKISNVILLFMLLWRLTSHYLLTWIFGANIPSWYAFGYIGIAYILTAAIVWLNRHRLASLNIDRHFVIALMIGGFLYLFSSPPDIGIPVAITAIFVFWAYQNNHLVVKNTVEYSSGTILFISASVLLALLPVVLLHPTIKKSISLQLILTSAFQAQLIGIVFEEVIFRGALWAYLRSKGLKELTIVLAQTFLFWIAHGNYILIEHSAFTFWVTVPLVSFLLGFVVWRSKSLTSSTIAHFLFNYTVAIIKNLF